MGHETGGELCVQYARVNFCTDAAGGPIRNATNPLVSCCNRSAFDPSELTTSLVLEFEDRDHLSAEESHRSRAAGDRGDHLRPREYLRYSFVVFSGGRRGNY